MEILKKIEDINSERDKLLKIHFDSYNEKTMKYEIEPEGIYTMAKEIEELMISNQETLPVDFMIEQLTKLGHAPCILYDDNGLFAVSGDGFQEIPEDGGSDIYLYHFIKKEYWKPTIREALISYLNRSEE